MARSIGWTLSLMILGFVQATAQPEFEAFAESETDFFYRVVDAQITFDRPEGGVAPSLTLHQNGKDRPGKRLP